MPRPARSRDRQMAGLTSILFPRSAATAHAETAADCFCDLHRDTIVDAITAGFPDYDLSRFFYAPLSEISAIADHHEVFTDLQRHTPAGRRFRRSPRAFPMAKRAAHCPGRSLTPP